jgi:hypothetical protein
MRSRKYPTSYGGNSNRNSRIQNPEEYEREFRELLERD